MDPIIHIRGTAEGALKSNEVQYSGEFSNNRKFLYVVLGDNKSVLPFKPKTIRTFLYNANIRVRHHMEYGSYGMYRMVFDKDADASLFKMWLQSLL